MSDYKYMRPELDDSYSLLKLQDKILEIMMYIDSLCREHEIDYCMMGGSALGAKRHGGFIPWDDDMDIFMTADQYEKFRTAFLTCGDRERFYLQEWGAVEGMITMSKIRMNGTTYIEEVLKDWDIHHGIFVDILILQVCPEYKLQQLHQCFWAKYVMMKGLAVKKYSSKKGLVGFILKLMGLFPEYFLVRHGLKQVCKYRYKKTDLYCFFLGRAVFHNAIYPKQWFVPTEYVPFETVEFRASKNLHEFLTCRFGNYMKAPSAEKIKAMQHAQMWDVDHDFRTVMNRNEWSFQDEWKLMG